MLDNAVINIAAAEMLADLNSDVQSTIINVLTQHPEMKLTGANVKELHDESNLTTTATPRFLSPSRPLKLLCRLKSYRNLWKVKRLKNLQK